MTGAARYLAAWSLVTNARSDGARALAVLAFVWLNAVLLRTLHQWFGVPLGLAPLLSSTLVQTSLSIFWALLALGAMLLATRSRRRGGWLTGAVLMAAVIAKLFLIDLSRTGSVERIVFRRSRCADARRRLFLAPSARARGAAMTRSTALALAGMAYRLSRKSRDSTPA